MRSGTILRWYALRYLLNKQIKDNTKVLDIGGYDGYIISQLKRVKKLDGIVLDLDKEGLKNAELNGISVILASATEIPVAEQSVDNVLLLDVIEHINDDLFLIREISRILKKNGKIILTTPIKDKKIVPFVDMDSLHKNWGHVRDGYTCGELNELLENNNLKIVRHGFYFNIFSRYAYYLLFCTNTPLIPNKIKHQIFKLSIIFEPFVKIGSFEWLVTAKKI